MQNAEFGEIKKKKIFFTQRKNFDFLSSDSKLIKRSKEVFPALSKLQKNTLQPQAKTNFEISLLEMFLKKKVNKFQKVRIFLNQLLLPIIIAQILIIMMSFIHKNVSEFCFISFCECKNFSILLYSFMEEMSFGYVGSVINNIYLLNFSSSKKIYDNNSYKFLYFIIAFFLSFITFSLFYFFWDKEQLPKIRLVISIFLIGFTPIFYCLLCFRCKINLKKQIFNIIKRNMFVLLFTAHEFFIKSEGFHQLCILLETHYSFEKAMNIFRIIIWLYSFIYLRILKRFLFFVYYYNQKNEGIPNDVVVSLFVFVSGEPFIAEVFNLLSIPQNSWLYWFFLFVFIFDTFQLYTRANLLKYIFLKIVNFIFKIRKKRKNKLWDRYCEMISGSLFELHLIIFVRIFLIIYWNKFFVFSRFYKLFKGCDLEKHNDTFVVYENSLFIALGIYLLIILILIIIIIKTRKILFFVNMYKINFFHKIYITIIMGYISEIHLQFLINYFGKFN